MRLLDLFSGIGGFSLGLERSGAFKTVAFCEIDPFCRRVLAKHWPEVPCYDNIKTLTAARLASDGITVEAICGGFPCQDISFAGKGVGLVGERSGLWREYARLISEIRPRYVIVENVAALLSRGLGDALADLAALGFDAEWHCIPASAVGAPHRRDRIWIVAYAAGIGPQRGCDKSPGTNPASRILADADSAGLQGWGQALFAQKEWKSDARYAWASSRGGWQNANWDTEPNVGRVANGVPTRVDRLRSLGNAVVPQIPEIIGRAIAQAEGWTK